MANKIIPCLAIEYSDEKCVATYGIILTKNELFRAIGRFSRSSKSVVKVLKAVEKETNKKFEKIIKDRAEVEKIMKQEIKQKKALTIDNGRCRVM